MQPRLRSPQPRDAFTPADVASVIVCVKKLREDKIIEHPRADVRVDTGETLYLRRREPQARHLEVLAPNAIERLSI